MTRNESTKEGKVNSMSVLSKEVNMSVLEDLLSSPCRCKDCEHVDYEFISGSHGADIKGYFCRGQSDSLYLNAIVDPFIVRQCDFFKRSQQ